MHNTDTPNNKLTNVPANDNLWLWYTSINTLKPNKSYLLYTKIPFYFILSKNYNLDITSGISMTNPSGEKINLKTEINNQNRQLFKDMKTGAQPTATGFYEYYVEPSWKKKKIIPAIKPTVKKYNSEILIVDHGINGSKSVTSNIRNDNIVDRFWNTKTSDETLPEGVHAISFWHKGGIAEPFDGEKYILSYNGLIKDKNDDGLGTSDNYLRSNAGIGYDLNSTTGIFTEWYVNGTLITEGKKTTGGYENGKALQNILTDKERWNYIRDNWTHHFIKIKSNVKVEWLSWFYPNLNGSQTNVDKTKASRGFVSDVRYFNSSGLNLSSLDINNISKNNITKTILDSQIKHEDFNIYQPEIISLYSNSRHIKQNQNATNIVNNDLLASTSSLYPEMSLVINKQTTFTNTYVLKFPYKNLYLSGCAKTGMYPFEII